MWLKEPWLDADAIYLKVTSFISRCSVSPCHAITLLAKDGIDEEKKDCVTRPKNFLGGYRMRYLSRYGCCNLYRNTRQLAWIITASNIVCANGENCRTKKLECCIPRGQEVAPESLTGVESMTLSHWSDAVTTVVQWSFWPAASYVRFMRHTPLHTPCLLIMFHAVLSNLFWERSSQESHSDTGCTRSEQRNLKLTE